jgi:uncharacterized protein YbaR (Trm112 family)
MPGKSEPSDKSKKLDTRLLEQLACPVCFGGLRMDASEAAICCVECGRAYPLIDGIPVLIPERVVVL